MTNFRKKCCRCSSGESQYRSPWQHIYLDHLQHIFRSPVFEQVYLRKVQPYIWITYKLYLDHLKHIFGSLKTYFLVIFQSPAITLYWTTYLNCAVVYSKNPALCHKHRNSYFLITHEGVCDSGLKKSPKPAKIWQLCCSKKKVGNLL